MKKSAIAGIFLGLGILLGFTASFLLRPMHHNRWEGKMNLSGEEKKQIRQLFVNDRENGRKLMDKLESASNALKEALANKQMTAKEIEPYYQKYERVHQEVVRRRFQMNLKVREVVGAEKMKHFREIGPSPRHKVTGADCTKIKP